MSLAISRQWTVKAAAFALLAALACIPARPVAAEMTLTVTATAYNSLHGQGAGKDHALAAWGDRLKPGMRAIAVSRDLLAKGLTHNAGVRIEGLPGVWFVKDKMNRRWKNKIDIYMGKDRKAARRWGRRRVVIHVLPKQ